MKKFAAFMLALILLVSFCGCNGKFGRNDLFEIDGIVRATVNAVPQGPSYTFEGNKATLLVKYLSNLHVSSDKEDDSHELYGYTWSILLEYENGETVTWYHVANTYLRTGTTVYTMDHEEAHGFETFLEELN